MEIHQLYYYIPILTTLFLVTKYLLRRNQNGPPSPFSLPLLGHLHLLKLPLPQTLAGLSARFGPVLTLWFGHRRVLLISSPSAVEDCLQKNDVVFANRPNLLAGKILGYNYKTLIWASYGDLWRSLRRVSTSELLSSHRLQLLAGVRADEVRSMVRRIFQSSTEDENRTVDVNLTFFELMHNVMMQVIAGKRYYGEKTETEEGRRYKQILQDLKEGVLNPGDFWPFLNYFGIAKRSEKKCRVVHEKTDKFMQDLVDERRWIMEEEASNSDPRDSSQRKNKSMVEVLLTLQKSDPQFYTDEAIKGLMLVLLVAGTDTSAATMEWAMSLLVNHRDILEKARNEIDSIVGHERLVEESDLSRLPYLHCIMKEAMRMYPVGPLLMPHESSDECVVGGYRVPKGSMLLVNVWAIQNDPAVWESPNEFKPERFINIEGDRNGKLGHKLLPFGAGRRACPGEALAMRIFGLTLASLLQCFEVDRTGEELEDMELKGGLAMPKAKPLRAKFKPRSPLMNLLSTI